MEILNQKFASEKDKNVNFLLGDGGSAILIEKKDNQKESIFNLYTDGSRYDKLIIKGGGYRHQSNEDTFKIEKQSDGQYRSLEHMFLAGMDVFSFSVTDVIKSIQLYFKNTNKTNDSFDFIALHQANKFMIDKIGKKTGFSEDEILYSIQHYGNTSNASIPISNL